MGSVSVYFRRVFFRTLFDRCTPLFDVDANGMVFELEECG